MQLIAEFTITLKTLDPYGHPAKRQTGIALSEDSRGERDRAFAAIRKMFPEARRIELSAVAKREVVQ